MLAPMVDQWPAWLGRLGIPESWQQFLDAETIRVEEFRDGDTLVVRAELPGIDPDRDVEVVVADGMLRIHAERTERAERTEFTGEPAGRKVTEAETTEVKEAEVKEAEVKEAEVKEAEARRHYRSEFRYGSFTRALALPAGVAESDVTAIYTDGILEVRVPMVEAAERTRTVPVTRG
jgi:HSP20 family protein